MSRRAKRDFVILTGLSGTGKSLAMRCLEDLGFFCVDNLPPALITKFAELCAHSNGKVGRVAVVTDIRGGSFFDHLLGSLEELARMGVGYQILFLDANDDVLVNRFKESRRRHPLAGRHRSLLESIQQERKRLEEVKERADKVIDTSNLRARDLKEEITSLLTESKATRQLVVSVISFGYKYGIPPDADLVFDVRHLVNPHYVEELRSLTGEYQEVEQLVMEDPHTVKFMAEMNRFLDYCLPEFAREGKSYLTIAIGCTGGRHRSIVVARVLARRLKDEGYRTLLDHRDIRKG